LGLGVQVSWRPFPSVLTWMHEANTCLLCMHVD